MPVDQITGAASNAWTTLRDIELGSLLPPFLVGLLIWARDTVPRGLGFASRTSHITGVIALTVVLILASFFVLTIVAYYYFIIAFPIALLRLIPAVEQRWPWTASDWPLWEVQKTGFDSGEVF